MKYLLIVLFMHGCTEDIEVKAIGSYETRILCENQKNALNKYHNGQHFLCVVDKSS